MKWLYNVGIFCYGILLQLASLLGNSKARLWASGRKDWRLHYASKLQSIHGCTWFHCASLGEFEQGRPVIESYREKYPEKKILLTFFSPSGYEIRKDYRFADFVCYLPLDLPGSMNDFIEDSQPSEVYFIKYEFWFNLLATLNKKKIPVYLVSAIFRESHWFFRSITGGYFLRELMRVRHFFVQDKLSAAVLHRHGITAVTVSGDTRFDRVITNAETAFNTTIFDSWCSGATTLVAGSTWPSDEKIVLDAIGRVFTKEQLILVPHELSPSHLESLRHKLKVSGLSAQTEFLSQITQHPSASTRIIIVDSIGLLSKLYRYASVAYIGGGFGAGIHNTLEAAVYGVPILFGPNYKKFREAIDLIDCRGADCVNNVHKLQEKLSELFNDIDRRNNKGNAAKRYVTDNKGATKAILDMV